LLRSTHPSPEKSQEWGTRLTRFAALSICAAKERVSASGLRPEVSPREAQPFPDCLKDLLTTVLQKSAIPSIVEHISINDRTLHFRIAHILEELRWMLVALILVLSLRQNPEISKMVNFRFRE
jgi:hypothetical protein